MFSKEERVKRHEANIKTAKKVANLIATESVPISELDNIYELSKQFIVCSPKDELK